MLRIYLVRHGQDMDNLNGILNGRRNEKLSPLGEEQAHELANLLKKTGLQIDKVYVSPLQRARQTAGIIAETCGYKDTEVSEQLIERDFGDMTGQPVNKIDELCTPHVLITGAVKYFLKPNNGETFPDLMVRAEYFLDDLKKNHKDGNILLVTHGDFGKALFAAFYDLRWEDALKMFHFGNTDVFLLSDRVRPESSKLIESSPTNS